MTRQLIAILRGVYAQETVDICNALIDAGITQIEVPLNSPDPFDAITAALEACKGRASIGAGTVTRLDEVAGLAKIGADFIVSPNCNPAVIAATKQAKMGSFPGVLTPTEAYQAIEAGADGLKLFPAGHLGPAGIAAMRAALPPIDLYAVGGAGPDNFAEYRAAGCIGFGLGSFLYKPGASAESVAAKAIDAVKAFDALAE